MFCKKLGVAALLLATVGSALFGFRSYVRTWYHQVQTTVNQSIPIEFELDRIKQEIAQLDRDADGYRRKVANEMVAVERKALNLANERKEVEARKADLKQLLEKLDAGERSFRINGQSFTREEVAARVDADTQACMARSEQLAAQERILEVNRRSVQTAETALAKAQTRKLELLKEVADIESEWAQVRMAQEDNKVHYDESRLGDIKKSVAALQDRIKAEKLVNDYEKRDAILSSPLPTEGVRPAGDVTTKAREYLEGTRLVDKK